MEPPTQRTLAAPDVQSRLQMTDGEWREVRVRTSKLTTPLSCHATENSSQADASRFRISRVGATSWGQLGRVWKRSLCIEFRTQTKYQDKFLAVETDADPWASWFLLSTARNFTSLIRWTSAHGAMQDPEHQLQPPIPPLIRPYPRKRRRRGTCSLKIRVRKRCAARKVKEAELFTHMTQRDHSSDILYGCDMLGG